MSLPYSNGRPLGLPALRSLRLPFGLRWATLGLLAIVALAAALRLGNPGAIGQANTYYTAAVASMLQSWRNFFFVAAEPGGSVAVDKPPVGLWIQALFASVLGVNGLAVVLPQILAGLASVVLLFHLVRRSFGDGAGLLAALVLAVTPVAVAVERNNTPDALLILDLLLAAWAFLKAAETGRLRFLLLGAFAVGVGFNIKMLQAFLPLPAFYALYFFGAAQPWRRKLLNLALATLLLIPVALSWAVAVDLTPADQRPYVGSSQSNSALDLAIGYNGLQRLLGHGGGAPSGNVRGGDSATAGDGRPQPSLDGGQGAPPAFDGPPTSGQGAPPAFDGRPMGGPPALGGAMGGPGGGGMFGIGQAGPLRLFQSGLAAQVSWLLPFGLLSLAALAAGAGWRRPHTALHRGLLLWGGWLLTCVVFFSVAGFFHQYYLAMLGAPLAALVAIGVAVLWRQRAERPLRAALLLLAAAAVTLAFQVYAVALYASLGWWVAVPLALGLAGAGALLVALRRQIGWLPRLGVPLLVAALVIIPTVWSGLTTAYANTSSGLTQAYGGGAGAGGMGRPDGAQGQARSDGDGGAPGGPEGGASQSLVDYLQARTQDTKYLVVVPSSQVGSQLVLATGRPVLYAGGFNGSDPVLDGDGLAALVAAGDVRYVLWGEGGGRGGSASISSYLRASCAVVTDAGVGTGFAGAGRQSGPGGASTLYRCGA